METLLTPREAAAVLKVKPNTLNAWRCNKRYPLPFVRAGRSIRYRAADVERFMESRTCSGTAK